MRTSNTLAALGLAPATRAAILHADDVGMCHGANTAFLELVRSGALTCGSVMVPCPWYPEIAREAAGDASLDLGVHLTLTSEWTDYRWAPLTRAGQGSGLVDAEGYFPPQRRGVGRSRRCRGGSGRDARADRAGR